jgi:hypothetical protein
MKGCTENPDCNWQPKQPTPTVPDTVLTAVSMKLLEYDFDRHGVKYGIIATEIKDIFIRLGWKSLEEVEQLCHDDYIRGQYANPEFEAIRHEIAKRLRAIATLHQLYGYEIDSHKRDGTTYLWRQMDEADFDALIAKLEA